tara:strand:- start:112 stop:771 length:660 start_codon:yes stop_codon:yes gene_type:complete
MKDKTQRKYIRLKVSFKNNHNLDKLFNILPNKSLFLKNKMNKKIISLLDFVINEVYEYMDIKLYNKVSLKEVFSYILNNKSLSFVKSKFQEIEQKWHNMLNIQYTSIVNTFKDLNQKSKLCKSIYNHYYNNSLSLLHIVFGEIKYNYHIDKKITYGKNILNFIYDYDSKLKINQFKCNFKLYKCFQNIYKKSINMIKYKQLCLFKYRYKCKQLEEFLDF